MFAGKPLRQFGQGQFPIGLDPADHYVPEGRQLTAPRRPPLAPRRQRTRPRLALRQPNRRRRTHTEPARRSPPRTPFRNRAINPATKIR
jgi:hypothetical protein